MPFFALLDYYSWTSRGRSKFYPKFPWQNLEIQGAPFVIRPPQKFRGVETLVRDIFYFSLLKLKDNK